MNKLTELSADDYFADKFGDDAPPLFSQSTAATLLTRSPLHAWRSHPKLGNIPREATDAMNKGTVVHDMLLGGGKGYEVIDAKDYRGKDAQAQRDAAKEEGKTPILAGAYIECIEAANAVRKQLEAYGIPLVGQSEGVMRWAETLPDGRTVECKARVDHWLAGTVIDLKTCADARPSKLAKHYVDFGYDIQAVAYRNGVEQNFGEVPPFLNIFVEMEAPFITVIAEPDPMMLALGLTRWNKALSLWADCLQFDSWPSYATKPVSLTPPRWMVSELQQ